MGDKAFLTSKELSDRWRLSDQTLANWRYAGKGPRFIRVGSRVLYPIEGINAFEQSSNYIGNSEEQQPQPTT
jgi:hypothetical protein